MPLLARHAGIWEGEYTHIAPDRTVQDQHVFRILVELPEQGPAYRQASHYWWPDGRTQQLVYEAGYRDRRIVFDNGRISGSLWELNERTQYMEFGYAADPSGLVCEMMQLSPDGTHRARTWHWLRNHELWRITLVRERRLAGGRAEFDRLAGVVPPPPAR
jgi:Lon protease-like protein